MTTVPFADLHAQYLSIKDEIDGAIAAVIAQSAFVRGPFVEAFEEDYARAMEAEHCVSCADGTAALYVAMHGLGIRPGDEVITTAHSWISTSETVSQHGAVPVFVDIDPDTYTIDPARIEEKITDRTVGIIPVHLYGQPADMDAIMAIARRRGLWVIEDCAQAHLATYQGTQGRALRQRRDLVLLPGQESGCDGRCGRDHHRRCRSRAADGPLRPPRRHRQRHSRDRGDQQPARWPSGRDPRGQAAPPSGLDQGAAGRRGPL